VEEGQGDGGGGNDDEAKSKPMLSFTEVLHAFESMRAFMYAHITKSDHANIINIERLYGLDDQGGWEFESG
jgi:hypothetical protein